MARKSYQIRVKTEKFDLAAPMLTDFHVLNSDLEARADKPPMPPIDH
jgi:hypothetical protein